MPRADKKVIVFTLLFSIHQSATYEKINNTEHFFSHLFNNTRNLTGCALFTFGFFALYNHYFIVAKGFGGGYQALEKYNEADRLEILLNHAKSAFEIKKQFNASKIEKTKQEIRLLKRQNFECKAKNLKKDLEQLQNIIETEEEHNASAIEDTQEKVKKLNDQGSALARQFDEEKNWKTHMHPVALSGACCIALGLYLTKK